MADCQRLCHCSTHTRSTATPPRSLLQHNLTPARPLFGSNPLPSPAPPIPVPNSKCRCGHIRFQAAESGKDRIKKVNPFLLLFPRPRPQHTPHANTHAQAHAARRPPHTHMLKKTPTKNVVLEVGRGGRGAVWRCQFACRPCPPFIPWSRARGKFERWHGDHHKARVTVSTTNNRAALAADIHPTVPETSCRQSQRTSWYEQSSASSGGPPEVLRGTYHHSCAPRYHLRGPRRAADSCPRSCPASTSTNHRLRLGALRIHQRTSS